MRKKITTKNQTIEKEVPVWFNKNIEATEATDEERQAIEDMLKGYR